MSSRKRARLLGGVAVLAGALAATQLLGTAQAYDDDSTEPQTMEQFLTSVTKDVDSYWTEQFKAAGLSEPRVSYAWLPTGQTAAYSPDDDTIYISQEFATGIYNGALDQMLPGSSQGFGKTVGDFAVAYIVAHEYGHQIQDELGLFQQYGDRVPQMSFELQADCYAGTWANSAYKEKRVSDDDVQEALDAALAVGDFATDNPGHHGTPEQREEAWNTGFKSGDPSTCNAYLS
jgi:predicted metalloprotease